MSLDFVDRIIKTSLVLAVILFPFLALYLHVAFGVAFVLGCIWGCLNLFAILDNSLTFSVGCHSGLNVPDADAFDLQSGTDWAQSFVRQRATFIGNTGYGYGDSELIAYSGRTFRKGPVFSVSPNPSFPKVT